MRRVAASLLALTTLASVACSRAVPVPEPFEFETIRKELVDEHCGGSRDDCTRIQFEYVQIRDPQTFSEQELNDWILAELLNAEPDAADIDHVMRRFIEDYRKDMVAVEPEFATIWTQASSVDVLWDRRDRVSLLFEYNEFSGGAHPNSAAQLFTLIPDPWRALELPEILLPGSATRFQERVEQAFRETRGLDLDEPLTALGLFVDGDRLPVPANFALVPEGLRIRYNSYEVGPYSFGPTDLLVPCVDLQGVVAPDWVCAG